MNEISTKLKILHLEDLSSDAELVARTLKKANLDCEIVVVENRMNFEKALVEFCPDVILSDHSLPSFDSIRALEILKENELDIPFILITSTMSDEFAANIMSQGANDYIIKDRLKRLPIAILNALEKFRLEKEKKEMQELVSFNEKRFRALIEKSTDMITLSTPEGKMLYGSPSITNLMGYSQAEIPFTVATDFIHEDEIEEYLQKRNDLLSKPGKSITHEFRLKHKDGRWIWCETTVTNMMNEPGINAIVANFRDISLRKKAEEDLQKNKNNLKALINNRKDLMWSVDRELNLVISNQPFIDYMNLLTEQPIEYGQTVLLSEFPLEMLNRYAGYYQRALNGETFSVIEQISEPHETFNEISFFPIQDGHEITGVACHSYDITSKKNAEDFLRKINQELSDYKYALDESSIVAITDQRGIIKHVNDNFCTISKFTRGELIGKDHRIINSGYHPKSFFLNLWATISSGNIWKGEVKNKAKDGTYYWVETTIIPFLDRTIKPYQYIAIRNDITHRKLIEEHLINSEKSLKESQAIAHLGNWKVDFATGMSIWSNETKNIYGIESSVDEFTFEDWLSFIHPDDVEYVMELNRESLKNLCDFELNHRIRLKNGKVKHIYAKCKFELDENGKPSGLFGITQDVTSLKLAEAERERMVEEIIHRSNNLEQFAYMISHNLRAPVANILGIVNLLKGDLTQKDRIKSQSYLFEATAKLDEIIVDLNAILDLKSEMSEAKQLVHFSELVESIEASLQSQLEGQDFRIITDFTVATSMLTIKGYIYSIFHNLISNSIKYRQPNLQLLIEVKSRIVNDKLVLCFKDNGIGIDLDKYGEKIFGLYKRFHSHLEGKGLGLFMVKTQVETLGGKISVSSKPNEGMEFDIVFPINWDLNK